MKRFDDKKISFCKKLYTQGMLLARNNLSTLKIIPGSSWPPDLDLDPNPFHFDKIENYWKIYEEFNEEELIEEIYNKYSDSKRINQALADSNINELDLIDFQLEQNSPTPSQATSSTSTLEQVLDELMNEDCANSLHNSTTINDEQGSLGHLPMMTFLVTDNRGCIGERVLFSSAEEQSIDSQMSPTITNEKPSTADEDDPSMTTIVNDATQPLNQHYWVQQNATNAFTVKTDSTQSSSATSISKSDAVETMLPTTKTRRQRNNQASKKLRMKRKRNEEDWNKQEVLKKKRKQDLEKNVDVLKIQVAELHKSLEMMTKLFAQDNLKKFKQLICKALDLNQIHKQDPDYTKPFKKIFGYFRKASEQYISVEDGAEIQRDLEQYVEQLRNI